MPLLKHDVIMLLVTINIHITTRHYLRPYCWINLYYFVTSVIPENGRFVFHYVEFALYFLWKKSIGSDCILGFKWTMMYSNIVVSPRGNRFILYFINRNRYSAEGYNDNKITIKKHFRKTNFCYNLFLLMKILILLYTYSVNKRV